MTVNIEHFGSGSEVIIPSVIFHPPTPLNSTPVHSILLSLLCEMSGLQSLTRVWLQVVSLE